MSGAPPPPRGYTLRPATPGDLADWLTTVEQQQRENGADGVYFTPWSSRDPGPPRGRDQIDQYSERLERAVGSPAWLRIWLAWDPTGAVVGHADLAGPRLPAESHRCLLGMGIVRAHHRRGLGRALLGTAVAWAREHPALAWIDLGVFSGNAPALELYRAFGFRETGRTPDRFRVDGIAIEDVQMVLRVGPGALGPGG